jgi:hypothetical protein
MEVVESGPLRDARRAALEGGTNPFGTEGTDLQWRRKDRYVLLRVGEGRPLGDD